MLAESLLIITMVTTVIVMLLVFAGCRLLTRNVLAGASFSVAAGLFSGAVLALLSQVLIKLQ